jgi:hypothetical protein
MRNRCILYSVLLAAIGSLLLASDVLANDIPVRVDTRVELLAIVFRLAGADEYNMSSSRSAYADEVARQFGPFKDHPAVKLAAKLRQDSGIGFDAVMSYAVHLKSDRLEPQIPFKSVPAPLDARWKPDDAARFLIELRRFAADSKADRFFALHQPYYLKAAARLDAEIVKHPYRAWLDSYFGIGPRARFVAIIGLLNGGGNYGMTIGYPDGNAEVVPVLGASKFDSEGLPVFNEQTVSVIVHEFCHSYTNPLVDRFAEELLPSGEKLFSRRKAVMETQAYGTPKTMLYESLVRACVVRFAIDNDTPRDADRQLMAEQARGFLWMPELVELLGRYVTQRSQYPNLQAFMPEVVAFFARTADSIDDLMAKLPRIVALSPINDDKKVDAATAELRIEFDRPMQTDAYALAGDPAKMPHAAMTPTGPAKARFSPDGKIFLLPVKLEPGKTYAYSINSLDLLGFRSAEGQFLDPVPVTFTTVAP